MIVLLATNNLGKTRIFQSKVAIHVIGQGRNTVLNCKSAKAKHRKCTNTSESHCIKCSLKWGITKLNCLNVTHLFRLQRNIALKGSEECVIRQMVLGRASSSERCKVSKVIIFYWGSYWIKKKFIGLLHWTISLISQTYLANSSVSL